MKTLLSLVILLCIAGCSLLEDAATSIAYDIERGVRHLGSSEGSIHVVLHDAQRRAGADAHSIQVQFDKVGALIVWYKDEDGNVLKSASTSYLSRFVDIPETIIVTTQITPPLSIEIQRRSGRAVVTRVY